jgi:hypothetical protein
LLTTLLLTWLLLSTAALLTALLATLAALLTTLARILIWHDAYASFWGKFPQLDNSVCASTFRTFAHIFIFVGWNFQTRLRYNGTPMTGRAGSHRAVRRRAETSWHYALAGLQRGLELSKSQARDLQKVACIAPY